MVNVNKDDLRDLDPDAYGELKRGDRVVVTYESVTGRQVQTSVTVSNAKANHLQYVDGPSVVHVADGNVRKDDKRFVVPETFFLGENATVSAKI